MVVSGLILFSCPISKRRPYHEVGLGTGVLVAPGEDFGFDAPVELAHALWHELPERMRRSGCTGDVHVRLSFRRGRRSITHASITSTEFVRVSPRDPRYFELSDGRPYIPIGLNMIAPPGNEGLPGLEAWMERLQANGGNYVRVWLSNPFFDVEHVRCGDDDEAKAKRIEAMLAIAARHDIHVKMCLEHFRHLGDGSQAWAAKPLHLVANGGTATNISDFFNGTASREQFKKKLAWFAQRFGDNPTVFGWELWNEINAVQGGDYLGWTEFMLPELHRLFPRNLAMQSLGSYDGEYARGPYRRLATMPGNDVAQVHRYLTWGPNSTFATVQWIYWPLMPSATFSRSIRVAQCFWRKAVRSNPATAAPPSFTIRTPMASCCTTCCSLRSSPVQRVQGISGIGITMWPDKISGGISAGSLRWLKTWTLRRNTSNLIYCLIRDCESTC